jgi:hypothetical protein
MARYFTDREKAEIREWLLELREVVNPVDFPANRDRARELVSLLDQRPTHPSSLIAYEYARVRRIWRRLAEECSQERRHGSFRNFDVSNTQI